MADQAKRREQKRRAMATYRKRHPERVRSRVRKWRVEHPEYDREKRARRLQLIAAFKNKACVDCGQMYPPVCMDFDHVRGRKEFGISRGSHRNVAEVLAEIEKCDVVCANCHRIRTAETLGWHKVLQEKELWTTSED